MGAKKPKKLNCNWRGCRDFRGVVVARLEDESENRIDKLRKRVYLQHENYREYRVIVNTWIDDFRSQLIAILLSAHKA